MGTEAHRVLIIEDDPNKSTVLRAAVAAGFPEVTIREERSYRSGVYALVTWHPNVVLLDMTLPTFDVTTTEPGGRPRIFGGKEVLQEMTRRQIRAATILVTQFESFGEGEKQRSLQELTAELAEKFAENFVGTVYYHPAHASWKAEIERLLGGLLEAQ